MPVIINFKKINPIYAKRLADFFASQSQQGVKKWDANTTYRFLDNTEFTFTRKVIARSRKNGKKGLRYESISHKRKFGGEGGFGEVIRIQRTLAFYEDSYRVKKEGKDGKRRMVKFQRHEEKHNSLSVLNKEYDLSNRAGHLHIKPPTVVNDPSNPELSTSYTVLDQIPGCTLDKIIDRDINGKHRLSIKQRLELSHALLAALKKQVTKKGIIHRDIKPENIIVHLGSPIIVKTIDYGLSMDINKPDGQSPGTPMWAAPEVVTSPDSVSSKTDIYSMARVIALLWGNYMGTYDHKKGLRGQLEQTTLPRHCLLYGIFNNIKGLHSNIQDDIKNTLLAMLAIDPNSRLSIDEAIQRFPTKNTKEILPYPPLTSDANVVLPDDAIQKAYDNYIETLENRSYNRVGFFGDRGDMARQKDAERFLSTYRKLMTSIAEIRSSNKTEDEKNAQIIPKAQEFLDITCEYSKRATGLTRSQKCIKAACLFMGVVIGGLLGVLLGTIYGIAIGAAIGSMAPGFGNIIGAVLGGSTAAVAGALSGAGFGIAIVASVGVAIINATPKPRHQASAIEFVDAIKRNIPIDGNMNIP